MLPHTQNLGICILQVISASVSKLMYRRETVSILEEQNCMIGIKPHETQL